MARFRTLVGIEGWDTEPHMNGAACMRHDVRRELQRIDWADVGIRLTAYAIWKARNLSWRTGRSDVLAGGKLPEDIAADAILKVLEGERTWDPGRGPLQPYLEGVVDSLMSHLAASSDNRIQERWSAQVHDGAGAPPGAADPSERLDRLCAALRRDHQDALLAVVDAVAAHCEPKPQAIAQHLGTTVADINNRLKRLRRYAQRIVPTGRARSGASTR
jgi:DNA-directed RNA polymerase specialized sigma24 family protein